MNKRIAMHAMTFSALALMCTSCATAPRQPSDNISGLIQNMMIENPGSGTTEVSPRKGGGIFSWLGRQRVRKHAPRDAGQNNAGSIPSGYSHKTTVPAANNTAVQAAYDEQEAEVTGYPINPGDQLTVSFFRKPDMPLKYYRVGCLDRLLIKIESQQPVTQEVVVRMDGNISFHLTQDLLVKGLTIDQVRDLIKDRLSSVLPAAEVTVFLSEGNVLAEDFLRRSNAQEQNEFTLTTVSPDGMLSLPLIGALNVNGMTPEAIRGIAQARYDELFNFGVALHMNLIARRGNTAILGEVGRPGLYPLYEARHPLFGLAMAGGKRDTADLKNVVILKRQPDGRLSRHFVNLKNPRKNDNTLVMFEPQDILIVPMSGIANVNLWVDQYIRRSLPLPTSAGVSATYSID